MALSSLMAWRDSQAADMPEIPDTEHLAEADLEPPQLSGKVDT